MLTIESGIPCHYANETIYPFQDIEVGDSFVVRAPESKRRNAQTMLCRAAARFGRRYRVKFTTRRVMGGVRCWRVK